MRIVQEINIEVEDFENSIFQELVKEDEAFDIVAAVATTYPDGFIDEAIGLLKLLSDLNPLLKLKILGEVEKELLR